MFSFSPERCRTPLAATLALAALMALNACGRMPAAAPSPAPAPAPATAPTAAAAAASAPASAPAKEPPGAAPAATRQQVLEQGDGKFIRQSSGPPPVRRAPQGDITLNFQNTEIKEFIRAVVGDAMKSSYMIDPELSGRVTLETVRPVTQAELPGILEEALDMHNVVMVAADDGYRFLSRNSPAAGRLSAQSIQGNVEGYGIRIVPLQFIAAQEMQKILAPFLAEQGELRVDKKRNLLILSGARRQLALAQETIDIFDVDWLRGMSVSLYLPAHVDPKALERELGTIVNALDGGSSKDLFGGMARTAAIERLNALLLIAATPAVLREIESWLRRLDQPSERVGRQLYVYNLENAKATELGGTLNQIFKSAASGNGKTADSPAVELAPGLAPARIGGDPGRMLPPGEAGAATDNPGLALAAAGNIEIIADDVRNALVILATPHDYKMAAAAIKKLDIVPLQVLIEASILEVSLSNQLSYGVEWFFKNTVQAGEGRGGRGTLDLGAAGIAALAPGFSYTIVDSADQVRFALNLLESETDINMLSAPSIMVLDNQTAKINVGDEVPVPARQSISNNDPAAPTVNEVSYRQTGVKLSVRPRVNSSGLVTMEIKQEVSSAVGTTSSDIDAPTIQQRQIESTVAVHSGNTIILGGLIREVESGDRSGVPVLHRLPLVGKLFGGTGNDASRAELLVLLTPRVIKNPADARDVMDEFRRKMKSITLP